MTPGSRGGTVRVALEAVGEARTQATVTYEITSLSDAGDQVLAAFTESAYAAMLADWEGRIARAIACDRPLTEQATASFDPMWGQC